MKNANHQILSWDTLFLLVLSVAHMWFNPVSSALIVTLLAIYVGIAFFSPDMEDELSAPRRVHHILFLARLAIVFFIVLAAALLPTGLNILQRHAEGPSTNANDGMIQTEEAIKFLLIGKNPYVENYLETPQAGWKGGEPPWTEAPGTLQHNAYLPFLFIVSIPFYLVSHSLIGWYDQRFLYILSYVGMLLVFLSLIHNQRDKLGALTVVGLNLLFAFFLADGRNDVLVLFGLVLMTKLLEQRLVKASALVLGCALMIKHTAWFFLPFYVIYLLPESLDWQSLRSLIGQLLPALVVMSIIVLPFLAWSAPAFLDDTFGYLMGTAADSYPIRGWGFSTLLLTFGIVPSAYASFPFGVLEILIGIPVLILLAKYQRHENTLKRMWFGFAILSFIVEYFSRFFNDNYFIFAMQALMIAMFIKSSRFNQPGEVFSV